MKQFWFKAKEYGWGWYPATWQGWLVLFGFVVLVSLNAFRIDRNAHSASDTLVSVIPESIVLLVILLVICWKTGERPRWRWGKDT